MCKALIGILFEKMTEGRFSHMQFLGYLPDLQVRVVEIPHHVLVGDLHPVVVQIQGIFAENFAGKESAFGAIGQ